jgi:hypothetical protein
LWNWHRDGFRYRDTDRFRHRVRDRVRDWNRHWFLYCDRDRSIYGYRDWLRNSYRIGTRDRDRDRDGNRDVSVDRDWVWLRYWDGNLFRHCEPIDAAALAYSSTVYVPDTCWTKTHRALVSKRPALVVLLFR